jgi:uncharacterized membrane protein
MQNRIFMKKFESAVTATVLIMSFMLILASCAGDSVKTSKTSSSTQSSKAVSSQASPNVLNKGDSLVIPTAEVTAKAKFYPVTVDGTAMEIIAVKAPDGTIRTAFNTCQVCYDSGRGYYKQSGSRLICQNCGNQFTMDRVEVQSGGCNPWPIFKQNKTVTDESISISYDFLKQSAQIFENWKVNY